MISINPRKNEFGIVKKKPETKWSTQNKRIQKHVRYAIFFARISNQGKRRSKQVSENKKEETTGGQISSKKLPLQIIL